MSGGAFNYLHNRTAITDDETCEQLTRVAALCDELGAPTAAHNLQLLVLSLQAARNDFINLSEVMRAVEWWQSGDTCAADAKAAAQKWERDNDLAPRRPKQ